MARSCPACTLLNEDATRATCELCGCELDPPVQEQPPKRPRNIRSFFRTPDSQPPTQPPPTAPTQPPTPPPPSPPPATTASTTTAATDSTTTAATKPPLSRPPTTTSTAPATASTKPPTTVTIAPDPCDLTLPLAQYAPTLACWRQPNAPIPYAHVAAALDALEATRSRLAKDIILSNAFRSILALRAPPSEIEAACYLLSPAKDAQTGGHRLRPDWHPANKPLGITAGSITKAILEASGAKPAQYRALYGKLRDSGAAALALRDGGGRQQLLQPPPPLTAGGVRATLLQLAEVSGTGAEGRKTQSLTRLLRAARGSEVKWLVRTFVPHMQCGVSLEASVLPALGMAALASGDAVGKATGAGDARQPSGAQLKEAAAAIRQSYAMRPDVNALVAALLEGGLPGVVAAGTLREGVPTQPMLAKPATSVDDVIARMRPSAAKGGGGARPEVRVTAEYKYDGQRCQLHRTAAGEIRLFSRKNDDMTYKYPDVVAAARAAQRSELAFVVDAEIVPVRAAGAAAAERGGDAGDGGGGDGAVEVRSFGHLATRKRKDVTAANAEATTAVQLVLFDMLKLGDDAMLAWPLERRRAAMHGEFACGVGAQVTFAAATDVTLDGGGGGGGGASVAASSSGPTVEETTAEPPSTAEGGPPPTAHAQLEQMLHRAVAAGAEGLMVKRLDSSYEPSTKRWDSWLKLKKDYIEGMGDSLDLVPIGGWRGQGRKKRWVSPWLMATYDPTDGTLGSVCRVMSGFTDAFYKENTIRFLGAEFGAADEDGDGDDQAADSGAGGEDQDADDDDAADDAADEDGWMDDAEEGDGVGGRTLRLECAADGVETGERPPYWFRPCEVWEIRGADVTVSPVHRSSVGLVHPERGLSLRFPRFIRKRPDKRLADATTPEQLAAIFKKQAAS